MRSHALAPIAAACFLSLAAQADPSPAPTPTESLDKVVVTGNPLKSQVLAQPSDSLGGDQLVLTRAANLGDTLQVMGQAEQALPFFRQNLEMNWKLYPTAKYPGGHPQLATSLNNLGSVLFAMGQAEQGLPYFR